MRLLSAGPIGMPPVAVAAIAAAAALALSVVGAAGPTAAAGTCAIDARGHFDQVPVGSRTGLAAPVVFADVVAEVVGARRRRLGMTQTGSHGEWRMTVAPRAGEDVWFYIAGIGEVDGVAYSFDRAGQHGQAGPVACTPGRAVAVDVGRASGSGLPIAPLLLPPVGRPQRRPKAKATTRPARGRRGTRFRVSGSGFRGGEAVAEQGLLPGGTATGRRGHADRRGRIALAVTGSRPGAYRMCLFGLRSGRFACTRFRVPA